MKRIKVSNMAKKVTVSFLAAVTLMAGIAVPSVTADAAAYGTEGTDSYADEILYDNTYNINNYWSSKTAPVKEGYVFGGWYADDKGATPLREESAATATTAYAKFVPAYVLSVKAQVSYAKTDGKSSIRLVSSVDSDQYAKVGFDVLLANRVDVATSKGKLETTTVYGKLQVKVSDTKTEEYEANQVFGLQAKKFSVWRLDGFADSRNSMIVNVTPYWITLDGTKVEGIAKYVHVEDGEKGYISVPVHVQDDKALAAGVLTMSYPDSLEVKDVEFCNVDGALVPKTELDYSDDGAGTITFVANAANVDENFATDGIYANVRFTVKSGSTYEGVGSGVFLPFEVTASHFSNWNEEQVNIQAWDVQY